MVSFVDFDFILYFYLFHLIASTSLVYNAYPLIYIYIYTTAGLGEFKIRDLNDEINKLLNEKRHWEERILELGGKDYSVCIHIFINLSYPFSCYIRI